MRHVHKAGERLFVDYAGQTVPLADRTTGEITRAQIFVAVLGASNYTFACASRTQQAVDWTRAIIAALEFIGGVPRPTRRRGCSRIWAWPTSGTTLFAAALISLACIAASGCEKV